MALRPSATFSSTWNMRLTVRDTVMFHVEREIATARSETVRIFRRL